MSLIMSCVIGGGQLCGGIAEQCLKEMSTEEKIGQLFILPMSPGLGERHFSELLNLVQQYSLGGIIPKQAHSEPQVNWLNRLQELSKYPLLVTCDAEWGLGMRMPDTVSFPRNLTLGAIEDDELIKKVGRVIGQHCRAVGAHLNFAPVADINNNPENPIIHRRSFGQDPQKVGKKVNAFIQGMNESGTLACAKHFPGHGDVTVDPHKDLPSISHSFERLEEVELSPFKKVINQVPAIMTGHLLVSTLDERFPASLSEKVVKKLLKEEWGYRGLIITDALNMKALTLYYPKEEIALAAFLAGHDLFLYGAHLQEDVEEILRTHIPKSIASFKEAIASGTVSIERLDESVLKILKVKERLGLFKKRAVAPDQFSMEKLHYKSVYDLKKQLFLKALTLVSSQEGSLPISLDKQYAFIKIGSEGGTVFFDALKKKGVQIKALTMPLAADERLDKYGGVIVEITDANGNADQNFGLSLESISLCEKVEKEFPKNSIFAHFGTPYALSFLPKDSTILVGYEAEKESFEAMAEVLVGEKEAKGELPVTAASL